MPTPTTFIQDSFGSPSNSSQRRKRKRKSNYKGIKLSMFVDGMILYIENPKDTSRTLLELINKFSKVAE